MAFLTGPIQNKQDVLLGVLMIRVDLHKLKTRLSDPTELPRELDENEEVLVGRPVDGRFRLLFASSEGLREIPIAEAPALEKATNQEKGYEVGQFLGEEVLVAYYPIEYQDDKPWGMIAKIPAQRRLRANDGFPEGPLAHRLFALAAGLGRRLCLGQLLCPSDHAVGRFRAAKFAQGDFGVRVPVESHDEIGRLSARLQRHGRPPAGLLRHAGTAGPGTNGGIVARQRRIETLESRPAAVRLRRLARPAGTAPRDQPVSRNCCKTNTDRNWMTRRASTWNSRSDGARAHEAADRQPARIRAGRNPRPTVPADSTARQILQQALRQSQRNDRGK